jgi:hypothetical protein
MIAALFVETNGCYFGLPDVDPWDQARDARLYDGPHPVVAHPPCQRWGNFWFGGTHKGSKRYVLGDDGGCFEAALTAVRKWGGVIEHPHGSRAWDHFRLNKPPREGGWVSADFEGGWTCCVDQGAYGHRARKATWLYVHGAVPPGLHWGAAEGDFMWLRALSDRRIAERGVDVPPKVVPRRECEATPLPFRDLLLSIARTARPERIAA